MPMILGDGPKFENTMTWSVFLEPGQKIDLFKHPACCQPRVPTETGLELKEEGANYPAYVLMRNCGWYAMVMGLALSRRDVVLTIESSCDRHPSDHSGPWCVNGKTLAKPLVLRAGDRFTASVRSLASAPAGPVDVQIAWMLCQHSERARSYMERHGRDPFGG